MLNLIQVWAVMQDMLMAAILFLSAALFDDIRVGALYVMRQRRKISVRQFIRDWALLILAVAAFGMYGLVLVSSRYIAAFVVLFWLDLLVNIHLQESFLHRRLLNALSIIAILSLLINIAIFNFDGMKRLTPSVQSNIGEPIAAPPPLPEQGFGQSSPNTCQSILN